MKNEERLKKLKEYMDSPEGKLSMEKHIQELEDKRKEKLRFFESEKFNSILLKIEKSELNSIDSDQWVYHGVYDFINKDEFYELFFSIWETLSDEIKIDESAMFSTEYVIYKKYKLMNIHGQGTVSIIEKIK